MEKKKILVEINMGYSFMSINTSVMERDDAVQIWIICASLTLSSQFWDLIHKELYFTIKQIS